ncbi:hypothetical protein [Methanonatronarchaeum sp. AMET-Sl]|uniref:hypothetical protein n=1 Tax=Methanonatronarchaeum sp. AMET-Sl TaxID=3037654 RepID=UPI00244DBE8E|nr:hypothetical protein [Methanonatronarchaeum sp. AMET-Sl]WGI17956.1 hypothetical protein QEN48_02835 [Methanonatronarchaeum sp. AMET-Sl]
MEDLKNFQKYLLLRNRLFYKFNGENIRSAKEFLETKDIPSTWKAGLEAELFFYKKFETKLSLTPTLDAGDNSDFSGDYNGPARFDVTTNLDYKSLIDYEKSQYDWGDYYIALFDRKAREFEILDINFPFCDKCGEGRLFPIIVVEEANNKPFNWVSLYEACSYDGYDSQKIIEEQVLCPTPSELIEDFKHPSVQMKKRETLRKYSEALKRFFKYKNQKIPFLLGEYDYIITDREGGGYWGLNIRWEHPVLKDVYNPDAFIKI